MDLTWAYLALVLYNLGMQKCAIGLAYPKNGLQSEDCKTSGLEPSQSGSRLEVDRMTSRQGSVNAEGVWVLPSSKKSTWVDAVAASIETSKPRDPETAVGLSIEEMLYHYPYMRSVKKGPSTDLPQFPYQLDVNGGSSTSWTPDATELIDSWVTDDITLNITQNRLSGDARQDNDSFLSLGTGLVVIPLGGNQIYEAPPEHSANSGHGWAPTGPMTVNPWGARLTSPGLIWRTGGPASQNRDLRVDHALRLSFTVSHASDTARKIVNPTEFPSIGTGGEETRDLYFAVRRATNRYAGVNIWLRYTYHDGTVFRHKHLPLDFIGTQVYVNGGQVDEHFERIYHFKTLPPPEVGVPSFTLIGCELVLEAMYTRFAVEGKRNSYAAGEYSNPLPYDPRYQPVTGGSGRINVPDQVLSAAVYLYSKGYDGFFRSDSYLNPVGEGFADYIPVNGPSYYYRPSHPLGSNQIAYLWDTPRAWFTDEWSGCLEVAKQPVNVDRYHLGQSDQGLLTDFGNRKWGMVVPGVYSYGYGNAFETKGDMKQYPTPGPTAYPSWIMKNGSQSLTGCSFNMPIGSTIQLLSNVTLVTPSNRTFTAGQVYRITLNARLLFNTPTGAVLPTPTPRLDFALRADNKTMAHDSLTVFPTSAVSSIAQQFTLTGLANAGQAVDLLITTTNWNAAQDLATNFVYNIYIDEEQDRDARSEIAKSIPNMKNPGPGAWDRLRLDIGKSASDTILESNRLAFAKLLCAASRTYNLLGFEREKPWGIDSASGNVNIYCLLPCIDVAAERLEYNYDVAGGDKPSKGMTQWSQADPKKKKREEKEAKNNVVEVAWDRALESLATDEMFTEFIAVDKPARGINGAGTVDGLAAVVRRFRGKWLKDGIIDERGIVAYICQNRPRASFLKAVLSSFRGELSAKVEFFVDMYVKGVQPLLMPAAMIIFGGDEDPAARGDYAFAWAGVACHRLDCDLFEIETLLRAIPGKLATRPDGQADFELVTKLKADKWNASVSAFMQFVSMGCLNDRISEGKEAIFDVRVNNRPIQLLSDAPTTADLVRVWSHGNLNEDDVYIVYDGSLVRKVAPLVESGNYKLFVRGLGGAEVSTPGVVSGETKYVEAKPANKLSGLNDLIALRSGAAGSDGVNYSKARAMVSTVSSGVSVAGSLRGDVAQVNGISATNVPVPSNMPPPERGSRWRKTTGAITRTSTDPMNVAVIDTGYRNGPQAVSYSAVGEALASMSSKVEGPRSNALSLHGFRSADAIILLAGVQMTEASISAEKKVEPVVIGSSCEGNLVRLALLTCSYLPLEPFFPRDSYYDGEVQRTRAAFDGTDKSGPPTYVMNEGVAAMGETLTVFTLPAQDGPVPVVGGVDQTGGVLTFWQSLRNMDIDRQQNVITLPPFLYRYVANPTRLSTLLALYLTMFAPYPCGFPTQQYTSAGSTWSHIPYSAQTIVRGGMLFIDVMLPISLPSDPPTTQVQANSNLRARPNDVLGNLVTVSYGTTPGVDQTVYNLAQFINTYVALATPADMFFVLKNASMLFTGGEQSASAAMEYALTVSCRYAQPYACLPNTYLEATQMTYTVSQSAVALACGRTAYGAPPTWGNYNTQTAWSTGHYFLPQLSPRVASLMAMEWISPTASSSAVTGHIDSPELAAAYFRMPARVNTTVFDIMRLLVGAPQTFWRFVDSAVEDNYRRIVMSFFAAELGAKPKFRVLEGIHSAVWKSSPTCFSTGLTFFDSVLMRSLFNWCVPLHLVAGPAVVAINDCIPIVLPDFWLQAQRVVPWMTEFLPQGMFPKLKPFKNITISNMFVATGAAAQGSAEVIVQDVPDAFSNRCTTSSVISAPDGARALGRFSLRWEQTANPNLTYFQAASNLSETLYRLKQGTVLNAYCVVLWPPNTGSSSTLFVDDGMMNAWYTTVIPTFTRGAAQGSTRGIYPVYPVLRQIDAAQNAMQTVLSGKVPFAIPVLIARDEDSGPLSFVGAEVGSASAWFASEEAKK